MKHTQCRNAVALFAVLIVVAMTFLVHPFSAAGEGLAVSLVTDSSPAPPVQHGLSKVKSSLQEKAVGFEQLSSLKKTRGETLVVAGIANGSGAAAKRRQGRPVDDAFQSSAFRRSWIRLRQH